MSSRDGGEAAADEAEQSGAAASPNRRTIMLGGVTVGAAGVIAGRRGRQGVGGQQGSSGQQGMADSRPRTQPAIRRDAVPPDAVPPDAVSPDAVSPDAVPPGAVSPDAVPPPTVEPDHSVTVLPYSFYGSSGDDFARINTAFSMLPAVTVSSHSYTVGRVNLGPFTYAGTTKIVKPVSADLAGAGPGTVLQPQAGGFPALSCHDPNTPPNGFGTYRAAAGTIRDLVIDGSKAGASSKGLDIGDGWGHKVCRVRIQNFTGPGAVGLYLSNQKFWTEKGHFQCTLWNNTTAAQLDVNGGQWSFEFNSIDFDVFVFAGQNGVIFTNGAYLCKGDFRMVGNFLTSNTGPLTTAALTMSGSGGAYHSHIADSRIAIELESNGGNTYAPQTINFGAGSKLAGCTGTLIFDYGEWTPSNAAAGQVMFGGVIVGDAKLRSANASPDGWR